MSSVRRRAAMATWKGGRSVASLGRSFPVVPARGQTPLTAQQVDGSIARPVVESGPDCLSQDEQQAHPG